MGSGEIPPPWKKSVFGHFSDRGEQNVRPYQQEKLVCYLDCWQESEGSNTHDAPDCYLDVAIKGCRKSRHPLSA